MALQVFQLSMLRARIGANHVARCVVYSFDVLIWLGLGQAVYTICSLLGILPAVLADAPWWILGGAALALIGVGAWRLKVAYAAYLKFDRSFATVMASQIIVTLLVTLILIALDHATDYSLLKRFFL
jgi:hypothetical protein